MADNVRDYLDARKRYDTAARRVSDLIAVIQQVSRHLTVEPMNFLFSNIPESMPAEVALARASKSVDANKWPTASQIQVALATLHEAMPPMFHAWEALSPDDRSGLQSPPEQFSRTRPHENI